MHREALATVATDALPAFAGQARTRSQRLAVRDEIMARTSMHYVDYRRAFDGWTRAELVSVLGAYRSDLENLACSDALRAARH
jgi:hypothetical protein